MCPHPKYYRVIVTHSLIFTGLHCYFESPVTGDLRSNNSSFEDLDLLDNSDVCDNENLISGSGVHVEATSGVGIDSVTETDGVRINATAPGISIVTSEAGDMPREDFYQVELFGSGGNDGDDEMRRRVNDDDDSELIIDDDELNANDFDRSVDDELNRSADDGINASLEANAVLHAAGIYVNV